MFSLPYSGPDNPFGASCLAVRKTGGATFWEGGDPASGGAAVAGMYANFLDGEPNNGGSTGQDCLVIGVDPHLINRTNIHPGE